MLNALVGVTMKIGPAISFIDQFKRKMNMLLVSLGYSTLIFKNIFLALILYNSFDGNQLIIRSIHGRNAAMLVYTPGKSAFAHPIPNETTPNSLPSATIGPPESPEHASFPPVL